MNGLSENTESRWLVQDQRETAGLVGGGVPEDSPPLRTATSKICDTIDTPQHGCEKP